MTLARICLTLSLLASPAALAQTAPKIDVTQDGDSYRIRVEAVLSSPARDVWTALTDCDRAREFVPHLEKCRILEKDPGGRWDVRENVANPPFLPRVRTVLRNEYKPVTGFSYRLVSGDMRVSEGSWSLQPSGSGTRVTYLARVEPKVSVPAFLVVGAIKSDLPGMMSKLGALSASVGRRADGGK